MRPIGLAIVLVIVTLVLAACSNAPSGYAGKPVLITVGMEATAVNSLIYIAENQNYFASNGLEVVIKPYPSGLAAVNGLQNHEVDIATASEFVLVGKALVNDRIVAIGSIDRFLHNYILGRRDRGIMKESDLSGKRVGVPLKTAAEFYLGRFLDLHGLSTKQVIPVDIPPMKTVEVIETGEVDAVIAWQPNVKGIEDRLGSATIKWPAQSEQATYCVALTTGDWATTHPELVERFLKALAQADTYNANHPDQARNAVEQRLRYDDAYMAAIWPEHQLTLSLEQALVLAMEDEARWMIANNLTSEKRTPDFQQFIYVDGLSRVKPRSVNIIR